MRFPIRPILAAGPLVVSLLVGPGAQSAGVGAQNDRFQSTMDRAFGPGGWRQTSGYRSPTKEDQLRRQGAGTVPAGRRSSHSRGSLTAPGAYDAVVVGMSQRDAAAMLRRSGRAFPRVLVEPAHGPQGPHLHVELEPAAARTRGSLCDAYHGQTIYLRLINGRQNPLIACEIRQREAAARTLPTRGSPQESGGGS